MRLQVMTLLAWKLLFPDAVQLTRGNHEVRKAMRDMIFCFTCQGRRQKSPARAPLPSMYLRRRET